MTNINKIVSNLFKDPKDDSNITYDELSNSFKSNTSEFIKKNSIYDFFLNENESDNITNTYETVDEMIDETVDETPTWAWSPENNFLLNNGKNSCSTPNGLS